MGSTAPKKRTSVRTKTRAGAGIYTPPKHREGAQLSDGFISSKKDKRTIKHSAFVNRIEKAHKTSLKRRRPSKKLITTLESLADALPTMDDIVAGGNGQLEAGKIRHTSLKSRPGAMKRREKLEREERARFGKNMAQLAAGGGSSASKTPNSDEMDSSKGELNSTTNRWAVLRGFISQTMEQKDEFKV